MKFATALTIGGVLLATPAFAQSTSPAAPADKGASNATVSNSTGATMTAGDQLASKLIGTTIKNPANETVGDISDLVVDKDGKVKAVVAGIGGFLGIGEHKVLIRYDQIQLNVDSNNRANAVSQMTRDQLKALPEWRDPNDMTRAR